jgi:hydroxyacyl-ACP dehydratase HTD2-like protein with hotdog domain
MAPLFSSIFNSGLSSHKIHYERTHTKEVEKHRDLVVHGPLVAQFLSDELRNQLGPEKSKMISSYKFRLNSSYYVDSPIICRGTSRTNVAGEEEWEVWAVDAEGRSGVRGVITLEKV